MPTRAGSPFLVVAISGRALAASARRGGHVVVVLDCFADRDTRVLAGACRKVAAAGALRLDPGRLLTAAGELAPAAHSAGLVPGSGFEACPDLLARLGEGRHLCGNPPEVIEAVKDPSRLSRLLGRLGVGHPEVRLAEPGEPGGWLLKEAGGAGGVHVRPASRGAAPAGGYFQRRHPGRSLSALFLADGHRALLLGVSEQWTAGSATRPFLYGGAVSHVPLPAGVRQDVADRLDALVEATGLLGLNGIDFLLEGDRWLLLEVNPRPTATMALYDPDYPRGLFDAHLRACRGELPSSPAPGRMSRAHAIVTAPAPWIVPETFGFPADCHDIPVPGESLRAGDPLCTVLAEAATPEAATALVLARREELGGLVMRAAAQPAGR